jgi:spermidine synthase
MACFVDLARFGIAASSDNVVFQSGHATKDGTPEVLVVEDTSKSKVKRRTLVFRSADGKCNPQAGTLCKAKGESSFRVTEASGINQDEALFASNGGSDLDRCAAVACDADVAASLQEPGAGYVRSMVGATALLSKNATQFLSIGLGAGTLALQLQRSWPESQQVAVELSSEVADAAKCFGASSGSGLDIVTGDGRAYLENSADGSFDAVFLDAFDASDKVPSCFTTKEFFAMAKRKLKTGGLLVMNAHSGKTLHNDVKDLLPAANTVFGSGHLQLGVAPGVANAIMLATAPEKKVPETASVFMQEASDELSSWLQDASFVTVESSQVSGPVLADAEVQCSR